MIVNVLKFLDFAGNRCLCCIFFLLALLSFSGCSKKVQPEDYSRVSVTINGKQYHMLSGYYSDADNRTLAGHEYNGNVCLKFHSLLFVKNTSYSDSTYYIELAVYLNKDEFSSNKDFSINRSIDSTKIWDEKFNKGIVDNSIVFASITAIDSRNKKIFYSTQGHISIEDVEVQPHLLYDGDRWVWKCKEVYYGFEGKSKEGNTICVTNGYCCL